MNTDGFLRESVTAERAAVILPGHLINPVTA
jgi:hypothetical protein